jgi:hypothetical protein
VDSIFKNLNEKLATLETDLKDYEVEVGTYLAKKTDKVETERLWQQMQQYALYQDLKDLYAKVIPPLAGFDEKMDNMAAGYEQSKEMLRRYDEVLTEKANKTAIKEL